jgi:hypothetical protein
MDYFLIRYFGCLEASFFTSVVFRGFRHFYATTTRRLGIPHDAMVSYYLPMQFREPSKSDVVA